MKRATFDGSEASAVAVVDIPRDSFGRPRMCAARGCPCHASVYMEGGAPVCSWHDGATHREWPRISQELSDCLARGDIPQRPVIRPADWVVKARGRVIRRNNIPLPEET